MKNYQRIINEAAQSSAHHLKANAKNTNSSAQKLTNNSDKKQRHQKNPLQESQNAQ